MCRLSVNVNKLATLRNSRGKNNPDVAIWSRKILEFGAHGLTVHPRPDQRHIGPRDVAHLSALVVEWNAAHGTNIEFNVEGYPSPDYMDLLGTFPADQATLVPDPPEALTSNAGWDLARHEDFLVQAVGRLSEMGRRVSLFVDPFEFDDRQLSALLNIRPARIELYTEKFAENFRSPKREAVMARYVEVAEAVRANGVGINAGHDLSQDNLSYLIEKIPFLEEVSVGHALICEALEEGFETTVSRYLKILESAPHGHSHAPRA